MLVSTNVDHQRLFADLRAVIVDEARAFSAGDRGTWAGYRVNATLKATLGGVADDTQRIDDLSIRLRADLRPSTWRGVVDAVRDRLCLPEVDEKALTGLKVLRGVAAAPGGGDPGGEAGGPRSRPGCAYGVGAVRAVANTLV